MSTPLTHIVLAKKFFNTYFKNENFEDFLIGNCFPDIRYFLKLERSATHFNNIDECHFIKNDTSFNLGFNFHNLIDFLRRDYYEKDNNTLNILIEKYLKNYQIDDIRHATMSLEEFILFKHIENWDEISDIFSNYKNENIILKNITIEKNNVLRWNKMLSNHFNTPPCNESIKKMYLEQNVPIELINKKLEIFDLIKNNPEFINLANNFYNDIDNIVSNKILIE